jgi:hypothetical protein
MSDHPVIVARKVPAGTETGATYRARIAVAQVPSRVAARSSMQMTVRLTNVGEAVWRHDALEAPGAIRLGLQLLDADKRLIDRDFHRQALPSALGGGESVALDVACQAPDIPGRYWLKFDVVIEGIAWLESRGGEVVVAEVVVDAPR